MSIDPELRALAERADARMLHLFMCDCAERAFSRLTGLGAEVPDESFSAVMEKRNWLSGLSNEARLAQFRAAAVRGMAPGCPPHVGAAALAASWLPRSGLTLPPDEAAAEQISKAANVLEAALIAADASVQAVVEAAYRARKDVDAARVAEAEERAWQLERLRALWAPRPVVAAG